ncbi:hypothetical protein TEA_000346 [Camellia sinensis var. sinensis]|uniref:Uncharacterized protein n=1 Tax=Camellia sinensis var. sinensis TaxID=542762 RepID=A0A4S4EIS1_CAMSN|nr:hypothetical protein TEA_000346 [Camellia sinensis var. sinensis]
MSTDSCLSLAMFNLLRMGVFCSMTVNDEVEVEKMDRVLFISNVRGMEFYVEFVDNDFLILMKVGKSTRNCEKFSCIIDKGDCLENDCLLLLGWRSPAVIVSYACPQSRYDLEEEMCNAQREAVEAAHQKCIQMPRIIHLRKAAAIGSNGERSGDHMDIPNPT